MKANGIRSKVAKKYKANTYYNHNLSVTDNILNSNFTAEKPYQKWVSDITYISTKDGWLYLAGVLDQYGRKLVESKTVPVFVRSLTPYRDWKITDKLCF